MAGRNGSKTIRSGEAKRATAAPGTQFNTATALVFNQPIVLPPALT
jgi:hypothetical protein